MNRAQFLRMTRGGGAAPPTPDPDFVTSVAHGGVGFFFGTGLRTKMLAGGIPVVETGDHADTLIAITPNGYTDTSTAWTGTGSGKTSFKVNGAQDDIYDTGGVPVLALSEYMAYAASTGGQGSALATWSDALQVDPVLRGSPYALAKNSHGCIWKGVHNPALTRPSAVWRHFSGYGLLWRLPTLPPDDTIWPVPTTAAEEAWIFPTVAQMNLDALGPPRTWPGSATGMPTVATCKAAQYFPDINPMILANAETRRRMMLTRKDYSGGVDGFGQDWVDELAATMAAGNTQSKDNLVPWARLGLMLFRNYVRGDPLVYNGAGQHNGHAQVLFLTAALFYETYPQFLDYAFDITSNAFTQAFWIQAGDCNLPTDDPGNHGYKYAALLAEMIGRVHWRKADGAGAVGEIGRFPEQDYEFTASQTSVGEVLNSLQLWFPGRNQYLWQIIANGYSYWSPTEPFAAAGARMDQQRTFGSVSSLMMANPTAMILTRIVNYYDARRPSIGTDVYKTVPEAIAIYPTRSLGTFLAATAGGFSWDWRNIGFRATDLTVTGYETRYGHISTTPDGRQCIVQYVNADNYTSSNTSQTGLEPGVAVGVSYRRENSKGKSLWSPNLAMYEGGDAQGSTAMRMVVTPTGTATGATVCTVTPVPCRYVSPASAYFDFEPAAASHSKSAYPVLVGGLGMFTGSALVGDTPTFQWTRGGVDIPGATSMFYNCSGETVGAVIGFKLIRGGLLQASTTVTIAA